MMKTMMTRAFAKTKAVTRAAKENLTDNLQYISANDCAEAFAKGAAMTAINAGYCELIDRKYDFSKHPAWMNICLTFANNSKTFKKVKRAYNIYNAINLTMVGILWAYKAYQERS